MENVVLIFCGHDRIEAVNSLKQLVIGTRLERPTRAIYNRILRGQEITEWDLRDARDSAYVRALLRKTLRVDSSCVDVGAHVGSFLCQILEFAPTGRHFAFEPIPELAEALQENFSTVEVISGALSDRAGETSFQYVPELPAWSGFQKQPYPQDTRPVTIPVAIMRLDDIVPREVPIKFIKIDVEGAELEVLRGSQETLKNCKPVVLFECAKIHHQNYSTSPEDVFDFFQRCGMGIFLMDESGPLSVDEFVEVYQKSYLSNYDRSAWTNFLAMSV
jgi:FkbM family methyltransferase